MFVYYFMNIETPFDEVERRVLAALGGLAPIADAAYREAEGIRARIGIGVKPMLAKTVRIDVGSPLRGATESAVPLTWEATGTPGLFPRMEADLVIASLGPDLTQLSLRGTYKPPLGGLGRALDRTVLHRIAEASVKSFVDRVASLISAPEAPHDASRHPRAGATGFAG